MLLDNYNEKNKRQFQTSFGKVFEKYAFSILRRIFNQKARKIKYGNDKEAGDCVVDIQRHVFIFEMKSGRFTKNVQLTGNIDYLEEQYTQKLIFRQLKQINKAIENFKANKFRINNLTFEQTKKIFPICITLTEIPQFDRLRSLMDNYKEDKGYFNDSKIQPFQIIDIEELEILEALLTESYDRKYFLNLMKQKCGRTKYCEDSFVNMLYDIHGGKIFEIESKTMKDAYFDLVNRAKQIIFGRN